MQVCVDLRPVGIYLSLNEPDPAVMARSPNKMTKFPKNTTSDADIRHRRWLHLDFDADRPAGVAATAAQLEAARQLAAFCRDYLCAKKGWPAPVEALSGNGFYQYFRVDLAKNADNDKLVERVLRAIHHQAAAIMVPPHLTGAHVDLGTHPAGRVVRLPGTMNRKGFPSAELPHRRSQLLHVPETIETVAAAQLQELVSEWERAASKTTSLAPSVGGDSGSCSASFGHRLDVERWLRDRGVDYRVKPERSSDGWTVYLLAACPFNPEHGRDREVCVMQAPDGKLGAKCMHESCSGRGWREFRDAIGKPDAAAWQNLMLVPEEKRVGANGGASAADPSKASGQPAPANDNDFFAGVDLTWTK